MYYDKIWKKVIGDDERVEFEFGLSPHYLNLNLGLWFFAAVLSALLGIVSLWFLLIGALIILWSFFYYGYYVRVSNAFAFTNKRVLVHRGWLSTSMISVDFSRVTDVQASESFTDKYFFHTGRVMINTAGSGEQEIVITHIANPYTVKQKLAELMDKDEQASRRFTQVV